MGDPLIAVRAIHLASTAIVAGGVIFAYFIAGSELKVAGLPSTILFRTRMAWLLWTNLAAAIISGAAWLLLLAAEIGDQPLTAVFHNDTAWILLTQTRFGWAWQLRLLCVALLAGLLLFKPPSGKPSRSSRFLAALLAVGFLGALAWAGHGGATPGRAGYVHVGADLLHLVAAGIWLGGLIPLALLLGQREQPDDDVWAAITGRATHCFSNFGVVSVTTLLGSGIINTWFLGGGVRGLFGTDYGRLLLLKIALFVAMVCIATINRLRLMPRISETCESGLHAAQAIQRNALIEMSLGLGVIVIVSILGMLPPATHLHSHLP